MSFLEEVLLQDVLYKEVVTLVMDVNVPNEPSLLYAAGFLSREVEDSWEHCNGHEAAVYHAHPRESQALRTSIACALCVSIYHLC